MPSHLPSLFVATFALKVRNMKIRSFLYQRQGGRGKAGTYAGGGGGGGGQTPPWDPGLFLFLFFVCSLACHKSRSCTTRIW